MSFPSVYKGQGLSTTAVQGYEALRASDPKYYTDQRIQSMIARKEHNDAFFAVLIDSLKQVDSNYIKQERLRVRKESGTLFNIGNTCWFNSTLQLLFRKGMPNHAQLKIQAKDGALPLFQQRAQALLRILTLSQMPVTTETNQKLYDATEAFIYDLYQNSLLDQTHIGQQEDAHEGYQALMNYLGIDDLKDQTRSSSLYFSSVQYGHISKHTSYKSDPEPLLVLQHGQGPSKAKSMQELISRASMSVEHMTGVNQIHTPDDQGLEDGSRINFFSSGDEFPHQVSLEVPRFTFNTRTGQRSKDCSLITFDSKIQVPLYNFDGKQLHGLAELELKSVICHLSGKDSASGGHYVTYEKQLDGRYTCYNDSLIERNISPARAEAMIKGNGYIANYTFKEIVPASQATQNFPTIDQVLAHLSAKPKTPKIPSRLDEGLGSTASSLASSSQGSPDASDDEEEVFKTPPTSPELALEDTSYSGPFSFFRAKPKAALVQPKPVKASKTRNDSRVPKPLHVSVEPPCVSTHTPAAQTSVSSTSKSKPSANQATFEKQVSKAKVKTTPFTDYNTLLAANLPLPVQFPEFTPKYPADKPLNPPSELTGVKKIEATIKTDPNANIFELFENFFACPKTD